MPEEQMVVSRLSIYEMVYNMLDGTWNEKIDDVRSRRGGRLSLAAGGASGDVSSQLTKTNVLTGVGTLSSAGMKFHLEDLFVTNNAGKLNTLDIMDSTTTMLSVILASSSVGTHVLKDFKGLICSTDCRVVVGTGPVHVRVGGLIQVVLA